MPTPKQSATCVKCGAAKPLDRRCKACQARYMREFRKRAPEHSRQRTRERTTAYMREYRASDPEKAHAHWNLHNARRTGRIEVPDACERCGSVAPLHGHHTDYSRALDVEWVCVPCHRAIHMEAAA